MAPFVCLRFDWADSLELVAEADHVDEGVYVDVNFNFAEGCVVRGCLGIDVDIANLSVEHDVVCEHVIHAYLSCQTPRVFQVQAIEAVAFGVAAQLVVEEPV